LIATSERNGPVVGLALVKEDDEIMVVTDRGVSLRTKVAEIRETGRNAQGVRVMNVDGDERVIGFERLADADDPNASESPDSLAPEGEGEGEGDGDGGAAEESGSPAEETPPTTDAPTEGS
jgi:DNA gyrase subunit A